MFKQTVCMAMLLIAGWTSGLHAATRNVAATVRLVDGQVALIAPDQSSRSPRVGDVIHEGDRLVTGSEAEIQLDMSDGGFMAVRPDTQVDIREYRANGMDDDRSIIGLLKGSLRSITGWIGTSTPRNYAIRTPTATIGVRGTEHETAFIPEGSAEGEPGTYDTVYSGRTSISNEFGDIDVTPNRAGFASLRERKRPGLLRQVPGFMKKVRRHDGQLREIRKKVRSEIGAKRNLRRKQFLEQGKGKGENGERSGVRGDTRSGASGFDRRHAGRQDLQRGALPQR